MLDKERATSGETAISHRHLIKIESFKRKEWDRGGKNIIVNGEKWGWIEMAGGRMYGPTYHLHGMHAPICRTDKGGSEVALTIRPNRINGRHAAWDLRSANKKVPTTDTILSDWVHQAITDGHLVSPAQQDKEIADATAAMQRAREAADRKERARFDKRAHDIMLMIEDGKSHDAVKAAILDAMKWAQTQ